MRIGLLLFTLLLIAGCSEEKSTAGKAAEGTENLMDTVADKLDEAVDKVDGEGPMEEMAESMDDAASDAKENIGEAATALKEKAAAAAEKLTEKAEAVKKKVDDARSG